MTNTSRQTLYLELIDRLLQCPNGQEPAILDESVDLIDGGFVQALMQASAYFAHNDNLEAAKFLVFLAKELSCQLGLYTAPQDG
ncbi:hypothetical protein [Synechocystis sp. LKSZ1]|uniref:hypothetical protein n=1 Tax=Synechocystis sp. LKSZ1 TaxID=3144951 RepID=UPI00336BC6E3